LQTTKAASQLNLTKLTAATKRVTELEISVKQIQIERDSWKASVDQLKLAENQVSMLKNFFSW
jgi:hypothetical protein